MEHCGGVPAHPWGKLPCKTLWKCSTYGYSVKLAINLCCYITVDSETSAPQNKIFLPTFPFIRKPILCWTMTKTLHFYNFNLLSINKIIIWHISWLMQTPALWCRRCKIHHYVAALLSTDTWSELTPTWPCNAEYPWFFNVGSYYAVKSSQDFLTRTSLL
jgi:hypothetical protein